jgi:hypothetical protein
MGNSTPGVLRVTDWTHTATLDFFGKYTLGNFHASSDPLGGTLQPGGRGGRRRIRRRLQQPPSQIVVNVLKSAL